MREIIFDKKKEIRGFWNEGVELDGVVAVQESIKRATRDIMARTLKTKPGQEWRIDERLTEENNSLVSLLLAYFDDEPRTETEFDKWHKDTCNYILGVLASKYEVVHYGKAQKILNMTFKNLYCTKLGDKEAYFAHCHMPLDSYTLEWTFRNVYPTVSPSPTKEKTPSWSNLSGAETQTDEKEKYTYGYVTDLIKGFFDTYRTKYQSSRTILQAEFVIWKEIQLEMASEGFYSQLLANLDETDKKGKMKSFRKLLLQEKLDNVREFLNSNPQP